MKLLNSRISFQINLFSTIRGCLESINISRTRFFENSRKSAKKGVILHNTIESENALLWPDFHVKDISGYGSYCSQRVIEPTAVKFTYPTNDPDFPNIYVLLSPTYTQSHLAKKTIRYKSETIARFKPCTAV